VTGVQTCALPICATASSSPSINTWYHLVGIYNSSTSQIQLYVNGTLQSTQSVSALWNATGETTIGRSKWNGGLTDYWPGSIDEVRLYNYALTSQQINTVYQADLNNLSGGLAGYWPLSEGSGTTTQDASGNHNTAQINSTTWVTDGHSGDALNFNGTPSNVVDTNKSVVNTSTSFSVAAWVQISDLSNWHTAVSQDGNNISGFYLQYTQPTSGGQFAFSMVSSDSTGGRPTVPLLLSLLRSIPGITWWGFTIAVRTRSSSTSMGACKAQ